MASAAEEYEAVANAPVVITPDWVAGAGGAVATWLVGNSRPTEVSAILARISSGEDRSSGRDP